MQNGKYIFYTIQQRVVAESAWLTKEPIRNIRKKDLDKWNFCCFEYFGKAINPRDNLAQPKFFDSNSEINDVKFKTGRYGWWTLKYAKAAVSRLKKMDNKGEFDSRYQGWQHSQSVRHGFRIVKVELEFFFAYNPIDQLKKEKTGCGR